MYSYLFELLLVCPVLYSAGSSLSLRATRRNTDVLWVGSRLYCTRGNCNGCCRVTVHGARLRGALPTLWLHSGVVLCCILVCIFLAAGVIFGTLWYQLTVLTPCMSGIASLRSINGCLGLHPWLVHDHYIRRLQDKMRMYFIFSTCTRSFAQG